MQTTPVKFLSVDYFTLLGEKPELAEAFALGDQVIAISDGIAYEVLPSDEPAQQAIAAATVTPSSSPSGKETPVSPVQFTQEPTEPPAKQPSGLCGAGLVPLILIPFVVVGVNRQKRPPKR